MRILDPAAADTGGADVARLQARIDQLAAHVQQLEQERASLRWMAGHDELTGLANRRLFHALAPDLLRGDDCSSAVVILDLNGFKPINDTYGHDAGDEVLRVIAGRMAACLGDHLVARLGGDEFAALPRAPHADVPEAWWHEVAGSLSAAIAPPMDVRGHTLSVTASIGVVPAGRPADLPELLRRADRAMFSAKRHAKAAGQTGITWVVATERGDHTETYGPAAPEPAVACRPGDPVWVHRSGARRAGVVESACEWAALVRYRCPNGAGTMVDTIPTSCLTIRAETDPYLDQNSSLYR
ncbi:GGDEF domain-containing protein [Paractinoplanes atraurantiacus]|uniref:Diguanylate cyclase (GGDEF) domain-containing protein n=1 Tax=Paractinoplanes atraurantiacus TaxID=1036182 RepID=A0A285GMB2_9ACTN|nr:GGDEF domain-containing protein [Actinoplanes atraurantiacus]SNY24717.1 diguanylate cyclase (GGDEF) domain-containing protein [Actinoplanes atraurantiacus]